MSISVTITRNKSNAALACNKFNEVGEDLR